MPTTNFVNKTYTFFNNIFPFNEKPRDDHSSPTVAISSKSCEKIRYEHSIELAEKLAGKITSRSILDNDPGFICVTHAGGSQSVAYTYSLIGKTALMIAANSGLPGGRLGKKGHQVTDEDLNQIGQEENHIADSVLTDRHLNIPESEQILSFIRNKWGMIDVNGIDFRTIQGYDFVNSTDSSIFRECFAVENCNLASIEKTKSFGKVEKHLNKNEIYQAGMFFVAGPCTNYTYFWHNGEKTLEVDPRGSMSRTRNIKASEDYDFFKECIKEALRGAFDAMILKDVKYAIAARISTGIYAHEGHVGKIRGDYNSLLSEVLQERIGPQAQKRGEYFADVIMPMLP